MSNDPDPALDDLLTRLRIVLSQPVDFRATDTETTIVKVRLLTAASPGWRGLGAAMHHLRRKR